MRFDGGWLRLNREVGSEDIAMRGPDTMWVWIRLLCMANWKESSTYLSGQQVRLKPGQLATGLHEISGGIVSVNKIRGALEYLENTGRISQATSNQGRIITICKWADYQLTQDVDHKQVTNGSQTDHNQITNGSQHSEQGTINNEPENTVWFESFCGKYKQKFKIGIRGPNALSRFKEQIKSEEDFTLILKALDNYQLYLATEPWRSPKQSIETFLGAKKKPFWRDYIDYKPELNKPDPNNTNPFAKIVPA